MTQETEDRRVASSDEVAHLTETVEELRARIATLEAGQAHTNGNGTGNGGGEGHSRRDLLRLAGAAAVGAAGGVVLRAMPAAAATGSNAVMGATNDANTTTNFIPTLNTSPSPLVQSLGQGVTPPTVAATASSTGPAFQSIPLIGAIGPGGTLPMIGAPAVADYPGFAPIQGVGGVATVSTSTGPVVVSEGINGFGSGSTGIGVSGDSDIGYGVVGGSGGIDIAALGTGRILQAPLPDGLLSSPPGGPPNYLPNDFELTRDQNGVVWISQPAPVGAATTAFWRRLNSLIPITPVRLIDTRNATGGIAGPLHSGQTYTWQVAGTDGIPASAIGVVANFTSTAFTGQGFFSAFPGGTAWPGTSTLNWPPGAELSAAGVANSSTVSLGTGGRAGKMSVFLSNNGITSHLIVDVIAYIL